MLISRVEKVPQIFGSLAKPHVPEVDEGTTDLPIAAWRVISLARVHRPALAGKLEKWNNNLEHWRSTAVMKGEGRKGITPSAASGIFPQNVQFKVDQGGAGNTAAIGYHA